jgi:hypothetical protein
MGRKLVASSEIPVVPKISSKKRKLLDVIDTTTLLLHQLAFHSTGKSQLKDAINVITPLELMFSRIFREKDDLIPEVAETRKRLRAVSTHHVSRFAEQQKVKGVGK